MKKQRRIVFKVVDKETRKGTNFAISFKTDRDSCSPYIKTYHRNTTVEKTKNSVGIFTFSKKSLAVSFMRKYDLLEEKAIVLRVVPIGRGNIPKVIAQGGAAPSAVKRFYHSEQAPRCDKMKPPQGTICYPAVKVLD